MSSTPENTNDNPTETPQDSPTAFDKGVEEVFDDIPDDQFEDDQLEALTASDETGGDNPESGADGSAGDETPQANAGPEGDNDATPEGDPESEAWEKASTALMAMGMTADELAEMPVEMVLKMGNARIKEETPADETDHAGAEAENKDGQVKDDQMPATEFDQEAVTADILSSLTDDGHFDADESASISKAIGVGLSKMRGIKQADGKVSDAVTQLQMQIDSQNNYIAEMVAEREIGPLSEIYPELKEEGGKEALYEQAVKMHNAGMKFDDMGELMRSAAVVKWGATRNAEITKHSNKVRKLKNSGTPSTGKTLSNDDTVPQDSFEAGFNKAYDDVVNKK